MKQRIAIISLFTFITASFINAQTNFTTVNYNLSRTFTSNTVDNTNVGGDLVVVDNNTIPVCQSAQTNTQTIFSGSRVTSASVNVENLTGNGCITLIVSSGSTQIKKTIAVGTESGVLRFSNVTSIIVIIDQKGSTTVPETMTSSGTVKLWF